MVLNSFLAMALILQPFNILDYFWITFFNAPLNGTALFVFQPGFSLIQFIDASKHLYMIPFAFFSVFTVSRKNRGSYLFIVVFAILLFGSSYLFAPKHSNLNCVFEPCLKVFGKASGLQYLFLFAAVSTALSLIINFIINLMLKKFLRAKDTKQYKRIIIFIFLFLIFMASVTIAFSYLKYSKIPKYVCLDSTACSDCTVSLKCNYVDWNSGNLTLMYTINNYGDKDYACDVFMKIRPGEYYKKIADDSFIEHNRKYKVGQIVPYPKVDSQIELVQDCRLQK